MSEIPVNSEVVPDNEVVIITDLMKNLGQEIFSRAMGVDITTTVPPAKNGAEVHLMYIVDTRSSGRVAVFCSYRSDASLGPQAAITGAVQLNPDDEKFNVPNDEVKLHNLYNRIAIRATTPSTSQTDIGVKWAEMPLGSPKVYQPPNPNHKLLIEEALNGFKALPFGANSKFIFIGSNPSTLS